MTLKFTGAILGLDLATTSGFAYGCPGATPWCGQIRFAKPGAERAVTYRHMRDWLDDFVSKHRVDLICYESPVAPMLAGSRVTNIDTIKRLVGMAEHLEEWCYDRIELREAAVSQVRSHFLGTNRIKRDEAKAATIARCRELGWTVESDDEADACAVWHYQVCCLRPEFGQQATPLFQRY